MASDAVAQKLGVTQGALLQEVAPGSPAATAGLAATRRGLGGIIRGDVVTAVGGKQLVNGGALYTVLEEYGVGDAVELSISRSGDKVRHCLGWVGGWGGGRREEVAARGHCMQRRWVVGGEKGCSGAEHQPHGGQGEALLGVGVGVISCGWVQEGRGGMRRGEGADEGGGRGVAVEHQQRHGGQSKTQLCVCFGRGGGNGRGWSMLRVQLEET